MLPTEPVEAAIQRFVTEKYPDLDPAFMELVNTWGKATTAPTVKIGDVYVMKLLCETVFRDIIVPNILRSKRSGDGEPSPPAPKTETTP